MAPRVVLCRFQIAERSRFASSAYDDASRLSGASTLTGLPRLPFLFRSQPS